MVSKRYTTYSLFIPVAMVIGTSFTILMYQRSIKMMILMSYISGFLLVCIFIYLAIRPSKPKRV
ncbi:MAG: hypothetical protein K8R25_04045 [Methanosarcinales archaeon]|nr:hypothetical protein [Methanosarcinales archaeon]